MKTRILSATLAALLAVSAFVACGNDTTPPVDATAAPDVATTAAAANVDNLYTFVAANTHLYPGADPAVLTALGDPLDKLEAASCVHEGFDRVYYYAGFEVNTQPTADGREIITSIYLTDDSVTTPEGIYIGMARAEADGILGYESSSTEITFEKHDSGLMTRLNLVYNDAGIVTSIYYN